MQVVYGFYHGGDPRDFRPDHECCTPQEIADHKAACDLWNRLLARGVTPTPEACESGWRTDADGTLYHVLKSRYGIGTYSYDDEDDRPDDEDDEDNEPEPWPDAPGQLYLFALDGEPEPEGVENYIEVGELCFA